MEFFDKKIMTVMMQYDYGNPTRGLSGDKVWFFDNLCNLVQNVEPFWFDEYLNDIERLQIDLLYMAKEYKPDLIFFMPYTNQFKVDTLQKLKNEFETYAWFGDDQWRFDDYSSIYAPYFTYISTTDPWCTQKYEKMGINVIETQWAAQPLCTTIDFHAVCEESIFDVSFIGGANEYRKWFINKLKSYGIKVTCFGSGWSNGRVSYEEMERIFRISKINLNISNSVSNDVRYIFSGLRNFRRWLISPKRAEQIKARNFEIPCAGGFQLSNYVLGLEKYWKIGEEIAVYNSVEECAQQINYYLENNQLRENILKQGYSRGIVEHQFKHRLTNILKAIWPV